MLFNKSTSSLPITKLWQISEPKEMKLGASWQSNNPVAKSKLRYVIVLHQGFDDKIHLGELIVHEKVAKEVVEIFKQLFKIRYPIEKIKPISFYDADDEKSCADNNTSAFCSRQVTGSQDQWSLHSYGLAIDVNPLYNPYHKENVTVPIEGTVYLNRQQNCPYLLKEANPCVQIFKRYGWKWGGEWMKERGYVDYQHFYKELKEGS